MSQDAAKIGRVVRLLILLGSVVGGLALGGLFSDWYKSDRLNTVEAVAERSAQQPPEHPTRSLIPSPRRIHYTVGEQPFCLTKERLKEAETALERNDRAWFQNARDCLITGAGLKLRPVVVGTRYSKIILIVPSGTSLTGYTTNRNIGQ